MSEVWNDAGEKALKTGTKLTLAIVTAIALIGFGILASMLRHGFSARDQPTALEATLARSMRRLAMPRTARAAKNPIALSEQVLSEGRAHFADHCAMCHGNDGRGETKIGRNLYPKAPDMASSATQSLSDGELFYIIKNGIRLTGMPAWGEDTREDDRESWQLVHFIRHLPRINQEEVEGMKAMNPKTRKEREEEEEIEGFLTGKGSAAPHPEHQH